ncbi:radical SAM family heme chaperone HemW [Caproiciproducens faecalis]|uniref:Heme chaperone HemW n=1 Tax=Caproiciproducens faecalis TaxID=2820301 RepID=A0ABS7DN85_9FIRM|nr:radical SAM family heme chaperone HemW [Caproiciproducens faecalis]MBW7572770.1 radical SAM family heme chaperone HemW [Caproiciproducens faecalis]
MNNEKPFGLYLHVPFCDGKCPYCDFYSLPVSEEQMNRYTRRMLETLEAYAAQYPRRADTLYFGGGTPNLLGAERLSALIVWAKECFGLEDAEITVEVNPTENLSEFLHELRAAGANRLSIGLQSANDDELALLGRRHTAEQAKKTVQYAQDAGFGNISLDLMLAVQKQTKESLLRSIDFCADAGIQHLSAYLLKIEPDTVYGKKKETLCVPDDDEAGDFYLFACEELEKCGFPQYEISNFAKPGFESRHNLKYWSCEEYLGIGPAAHSFMEGKRFYYPRNFSAFLDGAQPVPDGDGGEFEEYAMLALRLAEGLTDEGCRARFGFGIPARMKQAAKLYEKGGLSVCTDSGFHFTPKGFLVSNTLTAEILYST